MNNSHTIISTLFFGVMFLPCICFGQQESKQNYTLFNPVPKDLMREMETDRPDVTESPYTVDAAHFQYETDLVRLTRQKSDEQETRTLLINQGNFKIGLTRTTAIQIGFQTYGNQKEKDLNSGSVTTSNGFGDITFRIKQNLIGNDKGNFALAVLPYVKFPTSNYEDSRFEGGLIVPMIYKLPGEWNLGMQVEVDRLKDRDQQTMHTEFLQTLAISHPIIKGVEAIAETYYTYDFKAHEISTYLNAAIQMEVAKDFQLDAGINYGLQHHAEKHYFIGASYRY
ncbi:Putative MetA-pathway of phenol degradation [Chryseobacterium wanjuense]|uniref:Putative MetA-pathway of phenol degradation n=1 Tax=Chryseobacterium wanjuense TaxID=356305 RepID=A0A1I0Q654_9FLAO|nr:transporter [Chryseobacterium wanjuense]SEW22421.1 Putative MetA-pathway of phenol degradation [Chryseobacterium wanjuense]